MKLVGKCSSFGGPNDIGMSNDTGLAFYEPWEANLRNDLFFPAGEDVPTWKRLRVDTYYCAINIPAGADRKWAKSSLWEISANGKHVIAWLVDRGPGAADRVVDCSPAVLNRLGVKTDDVVTVEEIIERTV